MWQIFLLNAVSGSTFTISKILLGYVNPVTLMTLRMLLGGSILLGYYYFYHGMQKIRRQAILPLAGITFFGIYISFILEFGALEYLTAARTALLFNLTPFFTALFAYYSFAEQMTTRKFVGLLIGFFGFFPILMGQSSSEELLGGIGFLSLPEMAIIISVVCYAYSWILIKQVMQEHAYSPLLINGVTMLAAGLCGIPTIGVTEGFSAIPGIGMFLGWLLLIVFLGNIVFNNLYGFLLNRYSVTFLSFTGFTIPFFTAFYDYIFFGEVLTWDFLISSAIVGIGLYIFYTGESRLEKITSKE